MTDTKRDEFIKAVRESEPPVFPVPSLGWHGFFFRNGAGEFMTPWLESAYIGWLLGRESQGVEANLFIIDGMDYTEVDEHEIALYHSECLPLNSSNIVTVERWHKLPSRNMKVSVDAEARVEWEWVESAVSGGE